ncbi:MAG: histidinol-phosphatase [Clostridia bacterium]|nr:histidinol-phosphatase [Clostridia bacterium]
MKVNYHTHTTRCMHAKGSDEDFVKAAIEAGFDRIGFSDHTPWNYQGFVSGMRMHKAELPGYVGSVRALQEKYRGQIEILLGLECEYFRPRMDWLKEQIAQYGLDYIILGHHFTKDEPRGTYNGSLHTPAQLRTYAQDVLDAMESGLFAYIAHPDIFMRGYPVFDKTCEKISRAIIEKALATDTPLEFNLLGLSHGNADGKQGYPFPAFWRMAGEAHVKAIVGVDEHQPAAYLDTAKFDWACETLRWLGAEPVTEIRLFSQQK